MRMKQGTGSAGCGIRRKLRFRGNRNVGVFYLFTLVQSIGRGIWLGNILSLYIVLVVEKGGGIWNLTPNELLGIASGITGVALLAVILPGGIAADRWSREGVLRIAAVFGAAGLLFIERSSTILHIVGGLFLWGLFQGLSRPAAESLLADSVPSGLRSAPYARVHMYMQFGMAGGPFINLLLFLYLGDSWDLDILKQVIFIGTLFSLISAVLMLFLREKYTLGEESEGYQHVRGSSGASFGGGRLPFIPVLLISSSFIIGLGAGMTVKFFPVFFRDVYSLKPVGSQLILGFGFLLTGLSSLIVQKLSLKRGRAQIIVLIQGLAVICLLAMAFYPPLWAMVVLFLLRGALMNAAQPLSRSIMMDYVPKQNRGFWNSLQTVAWGLFWNASAVLGGFLIGDGNFALCFFITAGIYTAGLIPALFLIPLVHHEKSLVSDTAR